MTPFRKVLLIIVLTLFAGYISLPREIPVKFSMGSYNIDYKFIRQDLSIQKGKLSISKNFDLVLGLDLAGGIHLVFEADTSGIEQDKKSTALDSCINLVF